MKKATHELIQAYFDHLYSAYRKDIGYSLTFGSNETYGELCYYSIPKLLKYVKLTQADHFLDIGCGIGKLIFTIFLTSEVASVTGIEINTHRYNIAKEIKKNLLQQLFKTYNNGRKLHLLQGDFLTHEFKNVTVVYVCSAVFSYDLLDAMGKKINSLSRVKKIISFRKLPHLNNFFIIKKIFLHCSWDLVACYIYSRKT